MLSIFIPSVFITLMFLLSGINKIKTFTETSKGFAKKIGFSIGLAQFVIFLVILLEIIAPIVIAAYTFTGLAYMVPFFKLATIGLIIFTVLCNAIYHNPMIKENYYAFMSNVSTLGGLMALYVIV